MRCPVCESSEWINVDEHRVKPEGMCMCKACGFVSYPSKYKSEDEIKEYYRKEYRGAPQVASLYTGERKLHYHHYFLSPLFEEWKKVGLDNPVIGEIGSAFGMFLDWIRGQVPGAEINGTELTTSMRKVAKYEYNLNLTEEFDYTKKYDLIVSYHVLEHQLDPDLNLKKYRDCLSDNGLLYLAAPVWFRDLDNSANGGFEIEEYWHPNHINSWGEDHLEWIIKKSGLSIVMKDSAIYGNTYLLKKTDNVIGEMPMFSPVKCLDYMKRAYKCWEHIKQNETALAIESMPNCPTAWVHHYEFNRAMFDKNKDAREGFMKQAEAACPTSGNIFVLLGDLRSRYEQFDSALAYFGKGLKYKPNNPTIIMGMSNCYRLMALKEKNPIRKAELIKASMDALQFIRKSSMEFRDKAISWLFHDATLLDL